MMGDDFRTSFMCLDNAWATKAAIHDAAGIKDPWNASDVSVPCWAPLATLSGARLNILYICDIDIIQLMYVQL